MSKVLSIIALMAEGGIVMVLLWVSISYVEFRRRWVPGDGPESFNRKVERVTLTVVCLVLISFAATIFNVR